MTFVSLVGILGGIVALTSPWVADPPNSVTYYRDVLPILQAKCQSCHRPGQVAPIAFTSYRQTRAWAERIKTMVLQRTMPPWSPGARYLSLTPHRMLTDRETDLLVRWVDGGALEGNPKDAPPPLFDDITQLQQPNDKD
jgi:hypothetical protein